MKAYLTILLGMFILAGTVLASRMVLAQQSSSSSSSVSSQSNTIPTRAPATGLGGMAR